MKNWKVVLAGLFLVGAAAWGAADITFDRLGEFKPIVIKKGLYIGPDTGAGKVEGDTLNKITRRLGATETFDFANSTIVCEDSTGVTVTGAAVGDACDVGIPAAPGNGSFTCYVSAANTVKGHFCPSGTATNPASGSYRYYITSNR